ncbi:hypothetical protein C9975_03095 [Thalassospira xiamenensis]|nr:hypothetical protein C9975_03095 [Thalassospira xiamenensis]
MFRFFLVIVLIGFLYLGYEFVSTYKAQTVTVAEHAEKTLEVTQDKATEAQQSREREVNVSKLTTPVWKLGTFSDKAWWVGVWGGCLFIVLALFRLWGSYRGKKMQGI